MGNLGHANFFPNHGQAQPGCTNDGCHHSRAVGFYIESINSVFSARQCSWANVQSGSCTTSGAVSGRMGGSHPANINLRGSFFLPTNAASPFSQG